MHSHNYYCDLELLPYADRIIEEIKARHPNYKITNLILCEPNETYYTGGTEIYFSFTDSIGMFIISVFGYAMSSLRKNVSVHVAYTDKGKILAKLG